MANESITIHYPLVKQLVGLIAIIIVFVLIFKDIYLAVLISVACYYLIAVFYIISFRITNVEFIVIYPYRFFLRKQRIRIDSIQSIDVFKKTGGKFNSSVIKISYIQSGKVKNRTISFLKPSESDLSNLVSNLDYLISDFNYHK